MLPGADSGNNVALASEPAPTGNRNPTVEWTSSPDQKAVVTDLPNRPDADSVRPATELVNGSRISCNFGAGTNTGLRFGDRLTVGAGAQWRGDLIVYDLLEPGAGRVRMLGTVGATGSATGEAIVQLSTSDSRVVLSGFLPNGVFMATTILIAILGRDSVGYARA